MATLAETLDALTRPAALCEPADGGAVRCLACAHACKILTGRRGICQVRFNRDGELMAPWGYVAAANLDPIEKKPFMHFLPGAQALTFGMLGCNFHCDFCQNWVSSQTLRDPRAAEGGRYIQTASPEDLVRMAETHGARVIVSSYNEPLITAEWSLEIFTFARARGLRTAFVSNGFASPQALRALQPMLDGLKVDLKCATDKKYRELGGRLEPVLDAIGLAHELGLWVEVVTLVIPGFNDSTDELWQSARAIAGISPDIPWHVTAYHPAYKRLGGEPTGVEALQRAADIGSEAGLRFIYAGNLPGRVGPLENTYCPRCRQPLVRRSGYFVRENRITPQGACPDCGLTIPGIWH